MFAALILFYFLALALISIAPSKAVQNPALQLLKPFFPSWKFFDEIGFASQLWVRVAPHAAALGAWELALPQTRRDWQHLFVNGPEGLSLAYHSLLQQTLTEANTWDLETRGTFDHSTAFKLTHRLALHSLKGVDQLTPGSCYQFKIRATDANTPAGEDRLISPIYEV